MKKIICALSIGFLCILALCFQFKKTETALSENFIRLHILANSDKTSDQELKLKVRDRIISETKGVLDESADFFGAKEDILKNIDKIKFCAEDEIRKNGFDYDVKVSLGKSDFPTKEYGELVLPCGEYEALKVEIGKGEGKNWWCVLFPPLCFVDEACVTVSGTVDDSIINEISEGEFLQKEKSPNVELKFKTYEIWQNSKKRIAMLFE